MLGCGSDLPPCLAQQCLRAQSISPQPLWGLVHISRGGSAEFLSLPLPVLSREEKSSLAEGRARPGLQGVACGQEQHGLPSREPHPASTIKLDVKHSRQTECSSLCLQQFGWFKPVQPVKADIFIPAVM